MNAVSRAIALMMAIGCADLVVAQEFPTRSVRIVTPYSSGSGPDLLIRGLAETLQKKWGQPVVIEARPGANGFVALGAVKSAPADPHQLFLLGNAHAAINPVIFKKIPYDIQKDFVPVTLLYRTPFFILTKADGPYQSIEALVKAAKADPGGIVYGSPYLGSPSHLGSAEFEYLTGTKMLHVTFKDTLQIFTSVARGDVAWAIGTAASTQGMIESKQVKLVAAASPKRLDMYPDVPTVAESGGPKEFSVDAWVALLAPAGTPESIVMRISDDIIEALGSSRMIQQMKTLGFEPAATGHGPLRDQIRNDLTRNKATVERVGISVD